MHRTNRLINQAFAGLVLGLLLSTLPAADARAQAPPAATPGATALTVPINGTLQIQMSTKKRIASAVNSKENIARIQTIAGDPTRILITGNEAGVTHITLKDEDNKVEELDVVVQLDVEYLRTKIRQFVPSANVEPIPISGTTIGLRGTVNHAEDVDVIMGIARGIAGNQVINTIKVGGVQQVLLCVTVAQVSRSEIRRMGFNFVLSRNDFTLASLVGGVGSPGGVLGVGGPLTGTLGSPNGAPTNLFLAVSKNGTNLLAFLQALKDENVVKLLAEPQVVTQSGRAASFLSGGEQAVPVPAGLGQVGVQFEEFGTRLNVLPVVLGEGKIHLEVEPEVSNLDAAFGTSINGTVVPGRNTQRVHTTVELEDGQTFVIGGLIQRNVTGSTTKVPVLGELPFIGAAFNSKSFSESESELVVLVTPHLVDGMAYNQLEGKLLPGQETRSPDDFELFLESILEAPRGQRDVNFPCGYVPAYKNGPSASQFPCGVNGDHGGLGCRTGSCGSAGCSTVPASPVPSVSNTPAKPLAAAPATSGDDAVPHGAAEAPLNSQPAVSGKPTVLPPVPAETGGDQP